MIDIHNHLLPAVDDGATDLPQAAAAVDRMYGQGVRQIVVTPHVRASSLYREGDPAKIAASLDGAWNALRDLCLRDYPELTLHRGTELMLDDPSPDLSADWLRLAGTRFVLLEFPGMLIPPRAVDALAMLVQGGYTPVVAHPERYMNAASDVSDARSWRAAGARLQVNCGSLLGIYGADAANRAWALLESGAADYLASDYHARGRLPLAACRRALEEDGAEAQGELLLCTNPARLLAGLDPVEVSPTRPRVPRWKKLMSKRFW